MTARSITRIKTGPGTDDDTARERGTGTTAGRETAGYAPTVPTQDSLDAVVTGLVPALSRSLAEQFNVFRVMHHGTYEKQLSNVFSWLLQSDATHHLGDTFQRILLDHVNRHRPEEQALATSGYHVAQEVSLRDEEDGTTELADLVLRRADACVVMEHYGTSDGHGHGYDRYLRHASAGGRNGAVVLLCARHEPHRLSDGWQDAVVATYSDLLSELKAAIAADRPWRKDHRDAAFFLNQLFDHFLEGPSAVNVDDRIAFITAMCRSGEARRYGHRPQKAAAEEFANELAQYALHQFEESRKTLLTVKRALRSFTSSTVMPDLNSRLTRGTITTVNTRFQGKWEWCVSLWRTDGERAVFLIFGPTIAPENERVPEPLESPDYANIFALRRGPDGGVDRILDTGVTMAEVLAGLSSDDMRLSDAVMAILDQS